MIKKKPTVHEGNVDDNDGTGGYQDQYDHNYDNDHHAYYCGKYGKPRAIVLSMVVTFKMPTMMNTVTNMMVPSWKPQTLSSLRTWWKPLLRN